MAYTDLEKQRAYYRNRYKNNPVYKAWKEENAEKKKNYLKEYRAQNAIKINEYRINNKDSIKLQRAEYHKKVKEKSNDRSREWYQKNKDKKTEYVKKNKVKLQSIFNKRRRERHSSDIEYKLRTNLRNRIKHAIKNNSKSAKSMELIGCTIPFLKQYIESQFRDGMTWENYGYYTWHIDHKKPCVQFDLSNPEEQKKCFHYTNLQPLFMIENLTKGKKNLNHNAKYGQGR